MNNRQIKLTISSPVFGVGVMLIDHENRILLGHRIKKGETPSWCFPGGKIEAKESLEQAAARELFEETNLVLETSMLNPFIIFLNRSNPNVNMTTGLVAHLRSDKIKKTLKVTEPQIFEIWRWFDFNDLPENLFPETEVMLQYWMRQKVNDGFSVYPLHSVQKIKSPM